MIMSSSLTENINSKYARNQITVCEIDELDLRLAIFNRIKIEC